MPLNLNFIFKCLPNSLGKFTKLLEPLLSYLRLHQVSIAGYIHDLITLSRSFVEFERNIKLIVTLLDTLGFVVHPDKS